MKLKKKKEKAWLLKTILILLVFIAFNNEMMGQGFEVSGKVTSQMENEETLPGVSIMVKGTAKGTVTDLEGNYQLRANPGDTLLFSYVGYLSEEKIVSPGQSILNVSLVLDIVGLDEVVVIGYGTQKKSDLTGAVSSISSEDLENKAVNRLEQALAGRAAGVQITQSTGQPGDNVTVRIRGIGTVNNADPLYVVDGLPLRDISYLNPNDIASIEVLKDASAAAIYGARGANGVILVTTKEGKVGEVNVSFNAYVGQQDMWKKPEVLDRDGFAMLNNEARTNSGLSTWPEFAPENISNLDNTDWIDAITNKALMQNYHLSINGGSDKSRYAISAGYLNQDGIIKTTGYEKYSARVNVDSKIGERIQIGTNIGLSTSTMTTGQDEGSLSSPGPLLSALRADPSRPVRRDDGEFMLLVRTGFRNPMASLTYFNHDSYKDRIVGNAFVNIELLDGLVFKSSLGMDYTNGEYKDFSHKYDMGIEGYPWDRPGSLLEQELYNKFRWAWEQTLTYQKTFGSHDLTALVGYSAEEGINEFVYINAENTPSNDVNDRYLSLTDGSSEQLQGRPTEEALVSILGRFIYSYNNKYLATASIRRDQSSKFVDDNQVGYFPSFSFGWKISEESFMSGIEFLDLFKLRGGWGQLGNQEIEAYPYTTFMERFAEGGEVGGSSSHGLDYPFGGERAIGTINVQGENRAVRWELTEQINLGFDANMFNNRLSVTADYFVRNTNDMLVRIPVPGNVGVSIPSQNAGSVENKGFEFTTSFKNSMGNFRYEVGGNISFVRNKVTSLGRGGEPLIGANGITRTDVGDPIASFYGSKVIGVFQNQDEIDYYDNLDGDPSTAYQPNAEPGDFIFADIAGVNEEGVRVETPDGRVDDNDRTNIGNPHPDFMYGFNANLGYKNFDLTMYLQGFYGNDVYYRQLRNLVFSAESNFSPEALDRWTGEGTSNTVPRIVFIDRNNNARASDYYVKDGSFLRIRNIQLGYTLPSNFTERINISRLRVYISAQNLFTFTKYPGFDPEIGQQGKNRQQLQPGQNAEYKTSLDYGIDRGTYPQSRVFMVGVNVNF